MSTKKLLVVEQVKCEVDGFHTIIPTDDGLRCMYCWILWKNLDNNNGSAK